MAVSVIGCEKTLHAGYLALSQFRSEKHRLPRPASDEDSTELWRIACQLQQVNGWRGRLQEDVLKALSHQASGELAPMTAVIGSIASHEILKACSGKFEPIHQFFYFESLESAPRIEVSNESILSATSLPDVDGNRQTRYHRQIAIFGEAFQSRLADSRHFLVGSGAIGVETLKLWACMGLGVGPRGSIALTDPDVVERTNLSRQFLFTQADINCAKSRAAAAAACKINPTLTDHIRYYTLRVGPGTESR